MDFKQAFFFLLAGVFILAGIMNCFFGYRFRKVIFGFWGFIIGYNLTYFLFNQLQGVTQIVALIAGVVGGIIGAVVLTALYKAGVFAIGALWAYLLGMTFALIANISLTPLILAVIALIGGLLALLLEKPTIIISTAFGGAWLLVQVFSFFRIVNFNLLDLVEKSATLQAKNAQSYILLGSWIVLWLVGMWVQFKKTAKK